MKRFLFVTLLLSVVWSLSAQDKALAIRNNLLQEGNNSVLVVAHRADWRNAPENSVQAIRNCIEMGVDMVEIDLKKTKDGHLIFMIKPLTAPQPAKAARRTLHWRSYVSFG